MQSEVQCAETTVDDHLRNLIQLMKRGGRVSVTDIPNDPTFLSSHFGGPTVQAMAEKLEAALSAAEPVGWQWRHPRATGGEWMHCPNGPRADKLPDTEYRAVYATPPAPSVAVKVKPLEWKEGNPGSYTEIAESPFGHYSVWEINGTGCWAPWKQGSGSIVDGGLAGAKAAAQADYEARIRSALSAQVQDVAGWHDISTAPQDGTTFLAIMAKAYSPRTTLCKVEDGKFFSPSQGEKFVVPGWNQWWPTHWMPLPAAPAKQEG